MNFSFFLYIFIIRFIRASIYDNIVSPELSFPRRRAAIADDLARESIKDSVAARIAAAEEVKKIAREKALAAELSKPY